jgi:hypothetical protein
MGSSIPMLIVLVIYVLLVKVVLPKFMKNRQAFKLTMITRIYNIFQVFACFFFVKTFIKLGYRFDQSFHYDYEPPRGTGIYTRSTYANWLLRLVELIETVFFVLRKKDNQVSFLHIYHHISTIVFVRILLKYDPSKLKSY